MKSTALTIKGHTFEWQSRTYVMGIINVTPDSFSGDGLLSTEQSGEKGQDWVARILARARQFVQDGADILDIGAESTRPGSQPVTAETELERLLPAIQAISTELDVIISVDTYKARVAEAVLEQGADMINDVWGLRADPDLGYVIARKNAPVILMHNRSSWVHTEIRQRLGGRYVGVPYENLIEDVKRELLESAGLAHCYGIPDEHIILDPGIGFGKTVEQNLELVHRLDEICQLGYPILVGPSRKSFIGYTLDLPPDQRLEGTIAATVVGIMKGANIIRVHDVKEVTRAARMTDALIRR